ncbi:hypothetical protein M3Y99_01687900 [Aphelenchoides fujianensis]|nr:hypothetical protein M3Y99_01687900 [Aphelenchoides fujianensis]
MSDFMDIHFLHVAKNRIKNRPLVAEKSSAQIWCRTAACANDAASIVAFELECWKQKSASRIDWAELTRIQQQQHKSNVERKASASSEESGEEAGAGDVLQQFLQLRQRIVCERFRLYGNSLEPRPSPGGEHDVRHARQHWQFAFPLISSDDRTAIYELTVEYLHRVQLTMTQNVGLAVAKADLDDVEMAALHLLLMTRPACSEVVKPATKEYLQWLRNQTLSSLAAYLEAGAKNVDERMGQIIFLITDFQNLCRLVKHAMRLLMVATDYQASPPEFVELFRESISFLTRYAVF